MQAERLHRKTQDLNGEKEEKYVARAAGVSFNDPNEDSDHYSLLNQEWDPDSQPQTDTLISHSTCLSVKTLKKRGACVDSGSQIDVTNKQKYAMLMTGKMVQLGGILATSAQAEEAGFPTVTDTGHSIIFKTGGCVLFLNSALDCIISLALMIKSGCKVDLKCCRRGDPYYGGEITLPDDHTITMIFEDNLWRLPMWTPAKA